MRRSRLSRRTISKRASLLRRLFSRAASKQRCEKIPSSGIGWACRGGMARCRGPRWPGQGNARGKLRRAANPRSKPIKRLCGSSSAELRIEAWIQNLLCLGCFQITDKAVLVFDLVEAKRRQIFRLPGIDLDRDQSQLAFLPGFDELIAKFVRRAYPERALVTGAKGDRDCVGLARGGRRAAGGFVDFVVKQQMNEIAGAL